MTSQDTEALKALVAKWRKLGEEGPSKNADPNPDYCCHTACANDLEIALERMLASQGEQREAQGDIAPENKEYVGLVCPICLIQLHPSAVLSDVVEHYYGNGTCPLYGKDFDARLMRGWQPKAPPLAESVGDVSTVADPFKEVLKRFETMVREWCQHADDLEQSAVPRIVPDYAMERGHAKQVEAVLPLLLQMGLAHLTDQETIRRHMQQGKS